MECLDCCLYGLFIEVDRVGIIQIVDHMNDRLHFVADLHLPLLVFFLFLNEFLLHIH